MERINPYGGDIPVQQPGPHGPVEEYGGRVEEQIEVARRSLNYPGRFAPSQPGPGTTHEDGRDHTDGSGL
jgi:hypothetical protein